MNDVNIYMDYAATAPVAQDVIDAVANAMRDASGNPSSKHYEGKCAAKLLELSRENIAKRINADPDEIYFTSGGTEADNWAIKGTMQLCGDDLDMITSEVEHHAVIRAAESVERMLHPVAYMPVDKCGMVKPETLWNYIRWNTKLVSVMLANNELGTIEPVKGLAEIAHGAGALFHTDAVQAVGHIPVDVKDLDVDMLSASGHKFGGPKGVGFLYIKRGTYIEPLLNGGGQELGKRAGTENVPGIVGMALALQKACIGMENRNAVTYAKQRKMITELQKISGVTINGPENVNRLPGIISATIDGVYNEVMLRMLDEYGICISAGSACNSSSMKPSHVLKAIGMSDTDAMHTVRMSISHETTYEDIAYTIDAIKAICERVRGDK